MSTITATLDLSDDTAGVIAGLLSRFPKGRRIRVALSDAPSAPPCIPAFSEFTDRVDSVCNELHSMPWKSTEEALRDIREGEHD